MKSSKHIKKALLLLLFVFMVTVCSFAQITNGETLWNTPVNSRVTIDNNNWYIVRKSTIDGANYVLLMYANAGFYPQQFNSTMNNAYEGSLLQSYMTFLYTNMNISLIRSMAVLPTLGDHSSTYATSEPTPVLATSTSRTVDIFFAPSYRDMYVWNGNRTTPLRNELRYGQRFWLRTSGTGNYVYGIIPQANMVDEGLLPPGNNVAAVPAVWVKTNTKVLLPINPGSFFTR